VTNFSLAVNETYKNGGGEKKTSTLWIRCVAWRRWLKSQANLWARGNSFTLKEDSSYGVTRIARAGARGDRSGRHHAQVPGAVKNGNGAKAAESSKPSDPVDESESPFNEPGREGTEEEDIPF